MPITIANDRLEISFTVPREAWENPDGILDAFASSYGWLERLASEDKSNPTFDDVTKTIANPITKVQHAINCIQNYVDDIWTAHGKNIARKTAVSQAETMLKYTRKIVRSNTKVNITRKTV